MQMLNQLVGHLAKGRGQNASLALFLAKGQWSTSVLELLHVAKAGTVKAEAGFAGESSLRRRHTLCSLVDASARC